MMVMKESIYTIPVNEVFEESCGCPICRMETTLEERCIEYILGAAMMEPDIRIETNKQGFCKKHLAVMLGKGNKLSLALMLETHLAEVKNNTLNSKKGITNKKKAKKMEKAVSSCYVCNKVGNAVAHMIDSIFRMYKNSDEFKEIYESTDMFCLPHYERLSELAISEINDKKLLLRFCEKSTEIVTRNITELIDDVHHFAEMFDYRNSGENADWGNSKDSLERTAEFL